MCWYLILHLVEYILEVLLVLLGLQLLVQLLNLILLVIDLILCTTTKIPSNSSTRSPRHAVTPAPPSFCCPATTPTRASPTPTPTSTAPIVVVVHPSPSRSDAWWTTKSITWLQPSNHHLVPICSTEHPYASSIYLPTSYTTSPCRARTRWSSYHSTSPSPCWSRYPPSSSYAASLATSSTPYPYAAGSEVCPANAYDSHWTSSCSHQSPTWAPCSSCSRSWSWIYFKIILHPHSKCDSSYSNQSSAYLGDAIAATSSTTTSSTTWCPHSASGSRFQVYFSYHIIQ